MANGTQEKPISLLLKLSQNPHYKLTTVEKQRLGDHLLEAIPEDVAEDEVKKKNTSSSSQKNVIALQKNKLNKHDTFIEEEKTKTE